MAGGLRPMTHQGRVLLVCAPWCCVDNPMLGISLLKAGLERRGIPCDIEYLNLRWSEWLLAQVCRGGGAALSDSQRSLVLQERPELAFMAGEWLFAQCYYGSGSLRADEYAASILGTHAEEWLALRAVAGQFLDECLERVPWGKYSLIGFTLLHRQLMSSLCLARMVKRRHPRARIVFGGPQCAGPMGHAMLRHFDFLDFVVDGEADETLPEIAERGAGEGLPGVSWRDGERTVEGGPGLPVRDLDALPYPSFEDYFRQVGAMPFRDLLHIRLPFEQSRGCWWGVKTKCTFCGLSPAALPFRSKLTARTVAEVRYLKERYGIREMTLCDNALTFRAYQESLLEEFGRMGDLDLIIEIKSNVGKEHVRALRRAGVVGLVAGIEALNSHVLDLMQKGVSALKNVECLKWCRYFNIRAAWNVLHGFPGEQPEDYAASVRILEAITHLDPPISVLRFHLCRFSPMLERAAQLGLTHVRPAGLYSHILPFAEQEMADFSYRFDFDYAEHPDLASLRSRIEDFVTHWKRQPAGDLLYVRRPDGGGRLLDTRFNRAVRSVDLDPLESSVYEACESVCAWRQLPERLAAAGRAGVGEKRLRDVLDHMVKLRVMVAEDDRYLAVALPDVSVTQENSEIADRGWVAIGS